jgi:hypothetical protein
MEEKYPNILNIINSEINKTKLIEAIKSIKLNISNVLFINDYVITTKIIQHYINTNIPISRNTNSITIRHPYASYIYYLTIYLLNSSNVYEHFSHGEFMIPFDTMYNLVSEIELLINCINKNNDYVDPLDEIYIIFSELINNTFDSKKYEYLLNQADITEDHNDELEKITDNFTEYYNNKIYLFDDNQFDTDDNSIIDDINQNKFVNNIKTNLVNILGK